MGRGKAPWRGQPCQTCPPQAEAAVDEDGEFQLGENEIRSHREPCRPPALCLPASRHHPRSPVFRLLSPVPCPPSYGLRPPSPVFRPLITAPLRQPVMPCARKIAISRSSVALLPCERMADITSERFALVKTSGITCRKYGGAGCERPFVERYIPGVHALVPRTCFDEIAPGQLVDGLKRPILR